MNFFNDLTTTQWAVLAAAIALLAFPRLDRVKTWLSDLLSKVKPATTAPTEPSIHAKVDAYQCLAADLPVELAREVWACIQSPTGGKSSALEPTPMTGLQTED